MDIFHLNVERARRIKWSTDSCFLKTARLALNQSGYSLSQESLDQYSVTGPVARPWQPGPIAGFTAFLVASRYAPWLRGLSASVSSIHCPTIITTPIRSVVPLGGPKRSSTN